MFPKSERNRNINDGIFRHTNFLKITSNSSFKLDLKNKIFKMEMPLLRFSKRSGLGEFLKIFFQKTFSCIKLKLFVVQFGKIESKPNRVRPHDNSC
jgi:hypothetical protein